MKFTRTFDSEDAIIVNDDGTETVFTIREVSGKQREDYRNFMYARLDRTATDSEGNPTLTKVAGMEAKLLCMCMHDPKGATVTQAFLDDLPGRVVAGLFQMAQKLNNLTPTDDQDAQDEEIKNG